MIVRAGVVFDGTPAAPRRNVDVVIEGERISELRDASGECDREAACIVPGLINAHAHLEMSGEPDPMSTILTLTPIQRTLRAVENAGKALRAGVTTMRDLGGSHGIAMEIRDAITAGRLSGPTIRAAGYVLCMTGGHGWPIGRAIDGAVEAVKGVREQRLAGADCIKLIATGGVLTKGAVPGVSQLTFDEMHAACTEARRHGMPVAAHAIGTDGINDALRAGVTSIEHGMLLDETSIELLKERGAYLVPTLSAPSCIMAHAETGAQPEYVIRKAREISERMTENLQRAFASAVRFAGGSDAGTPFNYHDAYADEVVLMHTQIGMSPQQALNATTATSAQLLGVEDVGTIAPGKRADLLLLSASIDRNIRTLRTPLAVMKNGTLVA